MHPNAQAVMRGFQAFAEGDMTTMKCPPTEPHQLAPSMDGNLVRPCLSGQVTARPCVRAFGNVSRRNPVVTHADVRLWAVSMLGASTL